MSDQILEKVGGDVDPLKKLALRIPGFKNFVERSKYRDADKLLRDTISKEAEAQYQRISVIQQDLISHGEIMYIDDLEQSTVKLRTFADRIRRAPRGYAGVFDAVKINQEELAAVYQFDSGMLDKLDEVSRAIDNVESSIGSDGLPASIRNLRAVSQQMIDTYNERTEVLKGIAGQ